MRQTLCAALAIAMALGARPLFGGTMIASATKIQGNATTINVLDGGVAEGVEAYTDRTHILVNIPDVLEGGDLLQVSNSDKSSVPYELEVTMGSLSLLYIGLDDRLPAQPLSWMNSSVFTGLPDGFFDTGAQIDIDESANGTVDQTFSLWVTLANPGSYNLGELDFGGNNYIVLASNVLVPEPSSIALLGLGLFGMIRVVRRRK